MVSGQPPLHERILYWASLLTAEQKMLWDVRNLDLIMQDYEWTQEYSDFVDRMLGRGPNLCFIVGPQGSGKTSALRAFRRRAQERGVSCYDWRWGDDYRQHWHVIRDFRYLLIDLPDYRAGSSPTMVRDLDAIGELWYESRHYNRGIIVTVQRELFGGHYLLGKGRVFELRPLTTTELYTVYVRNFESIWPFDSGAFALLGRLSRGIFRRFLRYVGLCVEDMRRRGAESVGAGDVRRVIDAPVVGRDMELEMSGFLRAGERELAVSLLLALLGEEDANQKSLASALGVTQGALGRLLGKLELRGYITRTRGDRKELIVRLREYA